MRLAMLWATALALAGCGGSDKADTGGRRATGNDARSVNPMPTDARTYVARASAGDLFEIESARIALAKAESAEVRGLAQMILADHQRSSTRLAAAVTEVRPSLRPATALDPAQQAGLERLSGAAGTAFDRVWLREQVRVHEQVLDLAAAYARGGDSAPLRRHAAATIAPVQTHLTRARRLESEALAQPNQ